MIKKLLIAITFIFSLSGLYAQTVTYGVTAGLNLTKLPAYANTDANGASVTNNYLAGFHAGGLVDIKFNSFTIQPGVVFTTKGGKSNVNVSLIDYSGAGTATGPETVVGTATVKTTLDYIEVPLNFMYRIPVGTGNIFFGAGPYIAIGISGKATVDATSDGQTSHQTQNITFGSGDNDINSPDFGFNAMVGYELNGGLTVSAGYGQSYSSANSDGNVKNEGFSFSVGYFFK